MRYETLPTVIAAVALGLGANACSLLGTYASSASSMMNQPGAMTAGPSTPGAPAASPASPASPTPTSPGAAKEPQGPSTVSVSMHNACPSTVKLFFGDKPKFGSGRYTSLSSNTRTSYTMEPGDMLWIVDDGQNGVDSVKVEASTRSVEIASSCDALRAR